MSQLSEVPPRVSKDEEIAWKDCIFRTIHTAGKAVERKRGAGGSYSTVVITMLPHQPLGQLYDLGTTQPSRVSISLTVV